MQLEPYLTFNGQCEAALHFYKDVFKGEITALNRFEGSPIGHDVTDGNKIMHASFVAGGVRFMASDGMGDTVPGSNITMSLGTADVADAERVFNALADGGTVRMPLADQFWGAKFGMLVDKYGIPWMINCDTSANSGH